MAAGGYRYVIEGAGSAGCVLAGRLSADPAAGYCCWRRAVGPEAGDPHTGGVHQTLPDRVRLELLAVIGAKYLGLSKRPRAGVDTTDPGPLIPTYRGVETISVAAAAKRARPRRVIAAEHRRCRLQPSVAAPKTRQGREADPTAAPGAAAVSDSGELARSRRFSSRNPWGVEQPIDDLGLPRPQLQPFPARCPSVW